MDRYCTHTRAYLYASGGRGEITPGECAAWMLWPGLEARDAPVPSRGHFVAGQ